LEGLEYLYNTRLGTMLNERVLKPMVLNPIAARKLRKPVMVVTITDGEPAGEDRDTTATVVAAALAKAAAAGYPGAVAFQFAQVGTDADAAAFLGELDEDPVIGSKIDATSCFEMESAEAEKAGVMLTPEMWLVKLLVGAVDSVYDAAG